ncbi:mCG144805, partial [Mus musculus]
EIFVLEMQHIGYPHIFGSKSSELFSPKLALINPSYSQPLLNISTKQFKLTIPEAPQIPQRRMTPGHSQTPVTMTFSGRVLHSCVTINF